MQEVVKAAVERRERGRFSRSRLRDERRSRSSDVTPASALGSIAEVTYTTPPATAGRPEEQLEMSVVEQEQVEGGGGTGATGESNRPTPVMMEQERNEKPKWTVLQAWSVFGFATCTVPWYLAYDVEKKEYILKSHWLQQIFCFLQHTLSLVVAAIGLSRVPGLVTNDPSPFTFIQITGILLAMISRLWFAKVVFFNRNCILEYHNMKDGLAEGDNAEQASNTTTRRSSHDTHSNFKIVGLALLSFGLFATLLIGADFGMKLHEYDEDWKEDGLPAVAQTSACFARMSFLWRDDDTCGLEYIADKVSDLPSSEKAWSMLGLQTFLNAKMAQYQKIIGINTCLWMFFLDATHAMTAIRNTDQRAIQVYDHLQTRTEALSEFIATMLTLQMMEIATNIPEWSFTVFIKNAFLSVYVISILLGFFSFLVLGCYGALTAEKIKEEMAGARGRSSRPSTPRQMASFLFRLTRNSVGIGINGIFVLNFAVLFAYMSVVGTFVMVLYEVQKNTLKSKTG